MDGGSTYRLTVPANAPVKLYWSAILAADNVLGSAPTTNLNPEGKFPSMFEPIHGSAFDIAGKGVANPIGTFWTGALLLEHLGEKEAASRLMLAIETVTADKVNHCQNLGWQGDHPLVTERSSPR